jgi:hypothetical protein
MAHFAQLNENNEVLQIIVIANEELLNEAGVEEEIRGIEWCHRAYGQDTKWVQTSYNANKRKNYACVGGVYDAARDAFIGAQPYPSWVLDEASCVWHAPTPVPPDGKPYYWDEAQQVWVLIETE